MPTLARCLDLAQVPDLLKEKIREHMALTPDPQAVIEGLIAAAVEDIEAVREELRRLGYAVDPVEVPVASVPGTEGVPGPQPVQAAPAKQAAGNRIKVAPIPKGSPDAPATVDKLKTVIRNLRQAMVDAGAGDPGLYEGEAPAGTGGVFDPNTGLTALRRHGDLENAAHEISHQVAWTFELPTEGTAGMALQLAEFARFGSEPPHGLTKDERQKYLDNEGWAEFLRGWIVNPAEAESRGPALAEVMRQGIPGAVRQAMEDYGNAARAFLGLPDSERTVANVEGIAQVIERGSLAQNLAGLVNLPAALAEASKGTNAFERSMGFVRGMWSGVVGDDAGGSRPRIPETRMGFWTRTRFNWQNVFAPAYNRFLEAWERQGKDEKDLAPSDNFRILNRLLAGTDGKVLRMIFNEGLTDAALRPVVDHQTGQRMNWDWLLDPVTAEDPQETLRLIDQALAMGIEERTYGRGSKIMQAAGARAADFMADVADAVDGLASQADIEALIQTFAEVVKDSGTAAALKHELMTFAKAPLVEIQDRAEARKKRDRFPSAEHLELMRTLAPLTNQYGTTLIREAREKVATLTGIGGGLVNDYDQARTALEEREQAAQADPQAKAERKNLKEFLRRYRAWSRQVLTYMAGKGVFSGDQLQRMVDGDTIVDPDTGEVFSFYIDTHRQFDRDTQTILPGKKFTGSTRMIGNPLANLIEGTLNAIARADRNESMLALVKPLSSNEGKRIVLHDLGHVVPDEVVKEARKQGQQTVNGRKPYAVRDNGETQWWVFHPDIEASLEAARMLGSDWILAKVWGGITRLMRGGIVNFPAFWLRNAFRDTESRLVVSETATGSGLADVFKSYGKLKTLDGDRRVDELRALAGASFSGYVEGRAVLAGELWKHLDDLQRQGWSGRAVRVMSPRNWWRWLEKGGAAMEGLNRNAEFRSAYAKALKQGMSEYDALLYAGDKSRGLIDFAEKGRYGRQMTGVILFFNPAIQGLAVTMRKWKQVVEYIKTGRTVPEKLWRAFVNRYVITMGVMAGLGILLNLLRKVAGGDDEERKWRQIQPAIRDFHYMIPDGTGGYIAIPKEYGHGVFWSGAERIADYVMANVEGDEQAAKHALDGYGKSMAGALLPINDVGSLMGGFAPLVEAATNWDTFRDRNIIPAWEQGLDVERRDTQRASAMSKELQDLTGQDARILDHLLEGYLGNWGRLATATGKDAKWWAGTITGVMKQPNAWSSRDVDWVMDRAAGLGLGQDKRIQALRFAAKKVGEANGDEREDRLKKVQELAARFRKSMEERPQAWGRPVKEQK